MLIKINTATKFFYEISQKITDAFSLKWSHVHEIADNIMSGYAFSRSKNYIAYTVNLTVIFDKVTQKPIYLVDCPDENLYFQICFNFSTYFQHREYQLYQKYFGFFTD